MLDPGKRDKPLMIERNVIPENDFEVGASAWEPVASVWAYVRPLFGRHLERGRAMVDSVTHEVMLDYPFFEVRHNDRLTFEGRQLYVRAVVNPDEQRKELLLYCDEGEA